MKTAIALLFCFSAVYPAWCVSRRRRRRQAHLHAAKPAEARPDRPGHGLDGGRRRVQGTRRGKEQRTAMSGADNLVYHEMTIKADPDRPRSVRYYEKADSTVKFRDGAHAPSLADARRLVGVAVDPPAVNSVRPARTSDARRTGSDRHPRQQSSLGPPVARAARGRGRLVETGRQGRGGPAGTRRRDALRRAMHAEGSRRRSSPASNSPAASRDRSTTRPPGSNSRASTASTCEPGESTGSRWSPRRIAASARWPPASTSPFASK